MHPPATQDPGNVGVGGGVGADGGSDVGKRFAGTQVEFGEGLAHDHQVHVAVDETGEEGVAG